MTSLNPYLRIDKQMIEVVMHHRGLKKSEARAHAVEMLRAVQYTGSRANYPPVSA